MSPRSFIWLYASLVVGFNLISIVFKDVPASEPFKPFCANTARVVAVSLNVIPAPAATADDAAKPYFSSRTSVAEALAAPDKMFAASATER